MNQPNQNWNGYYNGYNGGQQNNGYPYANGYPYMPNQVNTIPQKGGGLAVASLICGIISVVGFWSLITLLTAIAGVVLGIVNNAQDNSNKGMAIAGIILNILGFLLTVFLIILVLQVE